MGRGPGRSETPAVVAAVSAPPDAPCIAGRYVLLRELGAGAMGSVHLAQDLQTGESVALKKLTRVDAKSVQRFKREFRALANVQLTNVVRLYDLEHEPNGLWFLTMEYVPGVDLISWLRPSAAPPPDWRSEDARVFSVFRQLARGVSALHGAGMLHRDLKPSNVLVENERVCVLDFGLVRGISEAGARVTEEGTLAGTPAYMAPEQISGGTLGEATDWYAFGVMLYEVLSGELPFEGSIVQVLRSKLEQDPRPLEQLEPDAPRALTDLCMALLQRDPRARPSGSEILVRLGASSPPIARSAQLETGALTEMQPSAARFVGCHASLEQLERALSEVEQGQTVAVHVRGPSGAGKSALLEHFLGAIEARGNGPLDSDVLILRSRCYEREAMPFKALDSVMDALVMDLARRDDLAVTHLLPADIQALAQLFPALERIPAVKKLLGMQRAKVQARSYRQRAEAALRDLFTRLAQARPLIVWVDDLHWGDLDSVAILRAWLEQTGGAPFLLLLSYRSDEVDTSPALRALLAPSDPDGARVLEHVLEVGPLPDAEVRALCVERLGTHAAGREALLERIVEDARGNPFLASQLASLALAKIERGATALGTLSLEDLVTQTRELLPDEGRRVLAVLAVAGRPMPPKLALRVAGVRHGGRAVLHVLRNLNLVRTRDADDERLIEVYHDRIREYVYRGLSPEVLRETHRELFRVLEHSGRAEPDWLHSLALGAAERALALQYGLSAAERAAASLAFERAAELYAACIELCAQDAPERAELWRKLGLVLGYSGRGSRAADALLTAAELCAGDQALELKRMAAAHLVGCGRFEQGDALFEELMAHEGIRAPRSESRLIAAVLWERGRLRMRGLSFQLRPAEQTAPAVLKRLDLLEDLRVATSGHDALRSVLFSTQSLRLALDTGEPLRVIRALSSAAMIAAGEIGPRARASCRELLSRAEQLLAEHGTARERLHYNVARAASSFYHGELREVLGPALEAERAFRELGVESADTGYFVRCAAVSCRVGALSQLDWAGFRRELGAAKQDAAATENIHALLMLALNETIGDEVAGKPELSIARLEEQRAWLPRERFTVLHVLHLTAIMSCACATGRHAWGLERAAELWDTYLRSPLRRTATLRSLPHLAHARLLLNEHVRTKGDPKLLHVVEKDVDALAAAGSTGQENRIRARLALLQGDRAGALEWLALSLNVYTQSGWRHEALRDQYAIGCIEGGASGEQAANAALDTMERELGCPDARRNLKAYLPELAGSL